MVRRWLRWGWLAVLLSVAPAIPAQVGNGEGAAVQGEVATSVGQMEPGQVEPGTAEKKSKGKTLFWVVLVLALLFVIGSASALNALGGRQHQPRSGNGEKK